MDDGPTRTGNRRPTLRDVAEAAGTSIKTASRVVNSERGVSAELRERVGTAVERLGYQRDDRARQLRVGTRATGTIGLIQNDVGNPFFASIFRGVEEVAAQAGSLVVSASSGGSPARQDEIVNAFISRRVDGLVIVPVGGDIGLLKGESRRGTPLVFVDVLPSELLGDVVLSDHRGGSVKAVRHLIRYGHRRIAFLGDDAGHFSARERYAAYVEVLAESGIDPDLDLVCHGVGDPDLAEQATLSLLDLGEPPTAFFSAQNLVSIGVVRGIKRRGASGDIAVVGFDDIPLADSLEPALTVAPQRALELGQRAGAFLFERLAGLDGPPRIQTLPVELLERGSGEIPGPWFGVP